MVLACFSFFKISALTSSETPWPSSSIFLIASTTCPKSTVAWLTVLTGSFCSLISLGTPFTACWFALMTVVSLIASMSTWAGFLPNKPRNPFFSREITLMWAFILGISNSFNPFWIASSTVEPVNTTITRFLLIISFSEPFSWLFFFYFPNLSVPELQPRALR